ncbi:hypothetical protein FQN49_001034 [Arthroderma sp. PD_2]|nr:hypothetical protein FQN49_001034 [Arthroderma sp. PD_2]
MDLPLSSTDGEAGMDNKGKQEKITCYSFDSNREYPNNVKCPNSDSCCETLEQCRPDRLCTSKDDPKTLIRAPCANKPWTNSCAQVCLYDNKESLILPRAVVCEQPGPANGSYCCDDNRTCCIDKAGFFLSNDGILIGRANETDDGPTSTPRPIGVPATGYMGRPAGTTSAPVQTEDDEAGLSTAAKAGIGVASGVVVLLAIIAGTLLFLRRQRQKKSAVVAAESREKDEDGSLPEHDALRQPDYTAELMGDGSTPELDNAQRPGLPMGQQREQQTEVFEMAAEPLNEKSRLS